MKTKNTVSLAPNTCVCSRVCKGHVGLAAHRKACDVYKADYRARV